MRVVLKTFVKVAANRNEKLDGLKLSLSDCAEKSGKFLMQTEKIDSEGLRKMFSTEKTENFSQQRNEKIKESTLLCKPF